jgi:hypothetical protein
VIDASRHLRLDGKSNMIFLKFAFNSLATAAFAAVAVGCFSFLCALVSKPNQSAVGAYIGEAVGAGILAGLAGFFLGILGTHLFPLSYLKFLVVSALLAVGLILTAWRILDRCYS